MTPQDLEPTDVAEPDVLIAAIVQLTGDVDLLERAEAVRAMAAGARSSRGSDADLAEFALGALDSALLSDRAAAPPADDVLCRLMTLCAGEPVPDDYLPLVLEEADFDGADARRFEWNGERPPSADDFRVGIIGGGFGGICAAIRLRQAGIDFTLFEKNPSIGGTWVENDYPDLRVDVPNHFYSYSFEPNPDWSHHYSPRAEIAAYLERCAEKHQIGPSVELEREVTSARYDESPGCWTVRTRHPEHGERTDEFDAVISAVGMLSRPSVPDLPGLDELERPWFHSARWDHGLDLAAKTVAVIGTGASAIQFVPAIAPGAERVLVFQRGRHWVMPNPDYLRPVTDAEKWLVRNVPYYPGWYRFALFWRNGDRIYPAFRVDPEWEDQTRSISLENEKLRRFMTSHVKRELGEENPLVEKVLPEYPPLGKRILQDNGWYRTLLRDDVELVTEPIERFTPAGVLTGDGIEHDVDVAILATGYHANGFLWPMEIVGRDGVVLHDVWQDDPRAYLGITMPGFPNLFCIYGPNTNPVVGSVIFMLECQVSYIMDCVRRLVEGGHASMECRAEVHDAYNERIGAELEQMIWRHPDVRSYYNNASGRVTTNAPWRLIDYWRMTRRADADDFVFVDRLRAQSAREV